MKTRLLGSLLLALALLSTAAVAWGSEPPIADTPISDPTPPRDPDPDPDPIDYEALYNALLITNAQLESERDAALAAQLVAESERDAALVAAEADCEQRIQDILDEAELERDELKSEIAKWRALVLMTYELTNELVVKSIKNKKLLPQGLVKKYLKGKWTPFFIRKIMGAAEQINAGYLAYVEADPQKPEDAEELVKALVLVCKILDPKKKRGHNNIRNPINCLL